MSVIGGKRVYVDANDSKHKRQREDVQAGLEDAGGDSCLEDNVKERPSLLDYMKKKDLEAKRRMLRRKHLVRFDSNVPQVNLTMFRSLMSRTLGGARLETLDEHCIVRYGLERLRVQPAIMSQKKYDKKLRRGVPETVGSVSVMSFDDIGCYLATGATDGGLCIFEFDNLFRRAAKGWKKLQDQAFYDSGSDNENQAVPRSFVKPICTPAKYRYETKNNIQALKWNEDFVYCGFQSTPIIPIYDLASRSRGPRQELTDKSASSKRWGCCSLELGQSKNLLYGGTTRGSVKFWDTRAGKYPQWESIASACGGKGSHSPHIVSSLYHATNNVHFFAGSTKGQIIMWDLRKLASLSAFSTKRVPTPVWSWNFSRNQHDLGDTRVTSSKCGASIPKSFRDLGYLPDGVVSFHIQPENEREIIVQLQSGPVMLYDLMSGKRLATTNVVPIRENESTSRFANVDMEDCPRYTRSACRRNCMSPLHSPYSNIACVGVPGVSSIQIVDLTPSKRRRKFRDGWTSQTSNAIRLDSPPTSLAVHPTSYSIVSAEEGSAQLSVIM